MHRITRSLAVATAIGALALAPALVAAATPVDNGCPASGALTSVAALEAVGPYMVPRAIDDPANGGNGDGWVCAFALPDATRHGGEFVIYQFHENSLKAEGRP